MFKFSKLQKITLIFIISLNVLIIENIAASEDKLSYKQVEQDIKIAKGAYEKIHPGYTRHQSKQSLDAAWQSVLDSAKNNDGLSHAQLYLQIQEVLTLIRCDHTKANLPKLIKEARKTSKVYLPILWDYIEARGFVSKSLNPELVNTGDEIMAIDGKPLSEVVADVIRFIPYDGKTIWSRNSGVTDSLEFMGGAVDHFGSLLQELPEIAVLSIKRRADDRLVEIKLPRVTFKQWSSLRNSANQARDFADAVHFGMLEGDVGYLKIDSFVNYRKPVKPKKIYDPIFNELKKNKVGTLILDLRNNGGGSTDARMALEKRLYNKKVQPKKELRVTSIDFEEYRPYLWTWDKRALKPNRLGFRSNDDGTYSLRSMFTDELDTIKPSRNAFKGKLIVLSSSANSSGSVSLLAGLKEFRSAIIVGEKTGGSATGPTAGLLFTLTLPESKIQTRVPFIRTINAVQTFEEGYGVTPDILAPLLAKDYLAGIDSALNKALEIAKE